MLRGFVHVNCQAQIPNSPTKSQKVHATNYSQVDFSKGQHPGETFSVWAGPNTGVQSCIQGRCWKVQHFYLVKLRVSSHVMSKNPKKFNQSVQDIALKYHKK